MDNFNTHSFAVIDDCTRCIDCEIGIWNGDREECPAYIR